MKAVIYENFATPDVLELREIEKPSPKDNEVLVKIYAKTETAGDWRLQKSDQFLSRFFNGLFKPTSVKILGFERAGVIEEVGKEVQSFKKGENVFASYGLKFLYAEYKCLPVEDLIVIKPSNMTFDEASAVHIGGLPALRNLKNAGLKAGDIILIYGSSGSVGTFAVQIAKSLGADVTAVCSTTNVNLVRSLGPESGKLKSVIDRRYTL